MTVLPRILRVDPDVGYRWYTCCASSDRFGQTVKLGPITFVSYMWLDGHRRVAWTWLGGDEHLLVGQPWDLP